MSTITTLLPLILLSQSAANGFDTARLNAISERLEQFVQSQDIAGAVTLVTRRGKVVYRHAAGFANVESKTVMSQDTVFQVMSMTKPITAIGIIQCAERGLLNLDDPVELYLPQFKRFQVKEGTASRAPSTKITIRHLLTHTSGMTSNDPGGLTDEAKAGLTLAQYAEKFGADRLESDPGEKVNYSGPGFAALGRIIEIVSGLTLDVYLKENLFAPLNMDDTFFFAPPEARNRLAYMYSTESGKLVKVQENPFRSGAKLANPAGGLYSTASDMAKVLECLIAGGSYAGNRIVSPAGVTALTTLQTGPLAAGSTDAQGYALGFSVVRSTSGTASLKSIGSFGHTGAFGTEFWADPKTGVVVVYMAQSWSDRVRKTFNTMVNAAFIGP